MASSAEGSKRRFRPRFFLETEGLASPPSPALAPPPVPPGELLVGEEFTLNADDSRYSRTVLRARPRDPCELVLSLSKGSLPALYECSFAAVSEWVTVRIDRRRVVASPAIHLTLIQGLPQPKLLDEVVEKGTEVGIDRFLILPTEGSPPVPRDRLERRVERLHRVAAAAARQSKQLAVPAIGLASWEALRTLVAAEQPRYSLVLEPSARTSLGERLDEPWTTGRAAKTPVADLAANGEPGESAPAGRTATAAEPERVFLAVGPEGGWSEAELERLDEMGERVSLGGRIMRTETAGSVAAAVVRFALRDW